MGTVRYIVLDGEIISENRNGVERDYGADPQGNTIALYDSGQNKTDTWTYWPYGEVKTRTGTTATPFQYIGTRGYYQDSSTKTYVRARYLDVQKGRWMTPDPIGYAGRSWNLYGYVGASPTTARDPSGLTKHAYPWFPGDPDFSPTRPPCNMRMGTECGENGESCYGINRPWPHPGYGKPSDRDITLIKSVCKWLNGSGSMPGGVWVTLARNCCHKCVSRDGTIVPCLGGGNKCQVDACVLPGPDKYANLPGILKKCVWEHETRIRQACYWLCDGSDGWQENPAERIRQCQCIQKGLIQYGIRDFKCCPSVVQAT